ncbi:MAG TPA: Ig-like domain-containing protein [Cyclobacteriaceae bacterium]|nr:Ig-like domain-containing protein [Cyclobacteriaceae bacterium]
MVIRRFVYLVLVFIYFQSHAQQTHELVFPDFEGWNILNENEGKSFKVSIDPYVKGHFTVEGAENLGMQIDSLGNFFWKPSFDLVDRVELSKDFSVIFQATLPDGERIRKTATFTVNHINRPPIVEELPVFYVRQSSANHYQIPGEYVYDPDGDPIVVKAIPSQMPEGAILSSLGQFTWTPSRSQFYSLRANPLLIEFIVQDQPDKLETRGKLRIQQTQQDLPPEILIVPGDSIFKIKEDETINLKIYVSDPNGDDNVKSVGFISNDTRLPATALKENTPLQHEFTWMPGYYFVDEAQKSLLTEVTFFSLDKSNNRSQRKVKILVVDAENLIEKDAHQFQKYRNSLISAMILIDQLDANQKKLNVDYKKAKKGKKNRSVLNASLGAVTGISPVAFETDQAKVVSGVGGTTVLTLGTLEATEVIGKSKEDILEKIKIGIDIRNRVQTAGDEFARKYSLKSARRSPDFEKDIDKLRTAMNDQKLVLLELDAYAKSSAMAKVTDKDIKKTFLDYSDE